MSTYPQALEAISYGYNTNNLHNRRSQNQSIEDKAGNQGPQGAQTVPVDPQNVQQHQKDCSARKRRAKESAQEGQGEVKLVVARLSKEYSSHKAQHLKQNSYHQGCGEVKCSVSKPPEDNQGHEEAKGRDEDGVSAYIGGM